MDKNAIKKYAVWARRELISRVSQKALQYGISEENIGDTNADTINGHLLTAAEQKQRQALVAKIKKDGYQQVMEEAAYTWFNRFCALRYMEVNGYLPTRVRVFTDEQNNFKPQIISEAIHLELDGLNMEKVYALKEENKTDELYKYLLITQCNALSAILPGLFQKIADYTELLFPDNLLREGSVIEQMIALIPEEDWTDQVQIIGWLYQYYNSEKKDDVFAALKRNVKITKENIPAATQLFTPDWIVHYMVENSLGRIFVSDQWAVASGQGSGQWTVTSGQGSEQWEEKEQRRIQEEEKIAEQMGWKYYLPEAVQTPEVRQQLTTAHLPLPTDCNVGDITIIDPCAGSGHILVVLFDVLVQIYEAYGYTAREAASMIVEHNLWGLDIDERAAQLSYFAVMMKARQYDRRFFSRKVQPHVYAIVESNDIDEFTLEYFVNGDAKLKKSMDTLMEELRDAKEYGSILNVTMVDFPALYARLSEIEEDINMHRESALNTIRPLIQVAEALAQKYSVTCTNPPYMGASNMNPKLNDFIKNRYADYKSDFFSAFVVRASEMTTKNGYCGFFTPYVWMFIQSYEKLRQYLYHQATIETLIQFEYSAFEEATVPVCTFAFSNSHVAGKKGNYLRLVDFRGGMEVQRQKTLEAIANHNCGYYYEQTTDNFSKIPGSPVAYWLGENVFSAFFNSKNSIRDYAFGEGKNVTTNNAKYILFAWEVEATKVGAFDYKWLPCAMGGDFRKWYGNIINVIDWSDKARNFYKTNQAGRIIRKEFWDLPGVTWSKISSAAPSFRLLKSNQMYQETAVLQKDIKETYFVLSILNTKVAQFYLSFLAPTINFQLQDICAIPLPDKTVEKKIVICELGEESVVISRTDWDSYETSWDFKRHPMLPGLDFESETVFIDEEGKLGSITAPNWLVATCYEEWKADCESRFLQLKANEEELNRIFIDIYGLQDELTPDVADKDVTVHRVFDTKDDVPESMKGSNYVRTMRDEVVSLISYAVGCMFGRYSLYTDGIFYAGGDWSAKLANSYPLTADSFRPDRDGIIPICDDDYFDDDITGRFIKWVETVYGADTLEENLKFIASVLGGKGSAREVIRNYFISDFYADHLKTYQKRPIYWLFDSGKKGGFKALIYMHRYQPDTIARIRTDYVHEQQSRYRTAIADLQQRINGASTGDRVKLTKQLTKLEAQADEIRTYEEKIHHLADQMIPIDLDDGVKVNYAKFADVLAKIK